MRAHLLFVAFVAACMVCVHDLWLWLMLSGMLGEARAVRCGAGGYQPAGVRLTGILLHSCVTWVPSNMVWSLWATSIDRPTACATLELWLMLSGMLGWLAMTNRER